VQTAFLELRTIYKAFGGEDAVQSIVTPDGAHEMDVRALRRLLA
jgi:hypothetical protein